MERSEHTRSPWAKLARIALGIVGILLLLVLGLFLFLTTPYFARMAGDFLSEKSGREIALGQVKIQPGLTPRIVLKDVRVGNADWAKKEDFFKAEEINFTLRLPELLRFRVVLPELKLEKPSLDLEKNMEGKDNWSFGENPAVEAVKTPVPENRFEMPIIGELTINDGILAYRDPKKKIDSELNVSTAEGEAKARDSIHFAGKGSFAGAPFKIDAGGASVLQLREESTPYPFHIKTTVGNTSADVHGTVKDPVKMEGMDVTLALKGKDAADLFPITGIALPPTPPYDIKGRLISDGKTWTFDPFKGKMGESDIKGKLLWDTSEKTPYLKADFVSENLDMRDLSGFIGADEAPADTSRVIPDKPIDISRLKSMNADVSFRGERVKAPQLLDNFLLKVHLKNGVLALQPLSFAMAKGKISANVTIDGTKQPTATEADVAFERLSMEALFKPLAEKFGEKNVSEGYLGGRAKLSGEGASLRDMMGSSNGEIGLGMEGGELSNLLLQLVGLDLFRIAGLVLSGDKPVPISCVVGDFAVKNGMMTTREFLIDTEVTTIRGSGGINLKNEAMDLELQVFPKKPSLLSARTPIELNGTLKEPSPGINVPAAAARGGAAVALGALLTPIGALLAFIEPGLGEDSHCKSFLQQIDQKTGGAVPKASDKKPTSQAKPKK